MAKSKPQLVESADFWDNRTKITLLVLGILFGVSVLFKLHYSSIPLWNQICNDGGSLKRGIVSGKPLTIRSDEWMVLSSFLYAQKQNNFQFENPALGYGATPILCNLPTDNFISYLRITSWGYYVLDFERGFSFYYNFRIFGMIISLFLLLKILTDNNFLTSLIGALFITFSSIYVWWSFHTDEVIFSCASFMALHTLLFKKCNPFQIVLLGTAFFLFAINFILILYPPFQIPVAYVFLGIFIGTILDNKKLLETFKENLKFKIPVLVLSLVSIVAVVLYFYSITKETIEVVTGTVYPGKRMETGGGFDLFSLFKENFHWFLSADKFPQKWANISELSSGLLISFGVIPLLLFSIIKKNYASKLIYILFGIEMVFIIWMIIGFPAFLSKATLFSMMPSYRSVYGLTFVNSILVFVVISQKNLRLTNLEIMYSVIGCIVFSMICSFSINSSIDGYFKPGQVAIATIIFSIFLISIILSSTYSWGKYILFLACIGYALHNIKANPVSIGLAPYNDNEMFKYFANYPKEEKQKTWVVFGQFTYSNYLKAAGLNVFSGVQYAPNLKKMKILDPTAKFDSVYNRYAHISFYPLIAGNDSIQFTLIQSDSYAIQMDPSSEKLKKFGVDYVVFAYQPNPYETRSLKYVGEKGLLVFKTNDK